MTNEQDPAPTTLPRTLPRKPEGFTRRMTMHLNYGRGGHSGAFDIYTDEGVKLPIEYAYNTGQNVRGFYLRGSAEPLTWNQICDVWPAYVRAVDRLCAKGYSLKDALASLRHDNPITMIVIYDHPRDRPDGFVAREWTVCPGSVVPARLLGEGLATINAARELVPDTMVNIGRTDDDDPVIAEVWI